VLLGERLSTWDDVIEWAQGLAASVSSQMAARIATVRSLGGGDPHGIRFNAESGDRKAECYFVRGGSLHALYADFPENSVRLVSRPLRDVVQVELATKEQWAVMLRVDFNNGSEHVWASTGDDAPKAYHETLTAFGEDLLHALAEHRDH
jgi:hypothetical protein